MGNKILDAMSNLGETANKINLLINKAASQIADICIEKSNNRANTDTNAITKDLDKLLTEFPESLRAEIYKRALAFMVKNLSNTEKTSSTTSYSSSRKSGKKNADRSSIFGSF